MAVSLTKDQVEELIKNPLQEKEIKRAKDYQARIKFHCQPQDELITDNSAYSNFVNWVKERLPVEKYNKVKKLIKTPISTVTLTGDIYNHFTKIFHASDSNREITIENEKLKELVLPVIAEQKTFFTKKVFERFKTAPCDFVAIQLPQEVEGDITEPFPEFISIECVIDAKVDEEAQIEYIIFSISKDKIGVIDGEGWKCYEGENRLTEVFNIPHELPYAPCRQLWTSNLNDNLFVKDVPVSTQLGDLDFLLFKSISREYAETYAEYPIVWMYQEDDNYKNHENLPPEDGMVTSSESGYHPSGLNINQYPNRRGYNGEVWEDKEKLLDGAGDILYKSYPKENERDIGEPAGFISADVTSLEYIKQNIEDRSTKIYISATGSIPDFKNDSAKNEKQVASQFESSKSIMLEVKTNFELIEKWVTDTIGFLMVGDSYEGSSINYGTNFFLQTVNNIEEGIKFAKDNGLNESYISEQYSQLISTKHKHDPIMKKRSEILFALEPLPTTGLKDAFEMFKAGAISLEDWELKKNFSSLIAEFEAKKAPIELFELTDREKLINDLKSMLVLPERNIQPPQEE